MKKFLVLFLSLCMLSTVLAGCTSGSASTTTATPAATPTAVETAAPQSSVVTMGTDKMGATGYVIGEAIANILNQNSDTISIATMTTSGGSENMYLLSTGEITMGNGTSRDWYASLSGSSPFTEPTNIYQMFGVAWYNMPLCVAKDSTIQSYSDLVGKRVFAGGSGSGSFAIYTDLFNTLGLFDKVTWVDCSWSDAYEGIRNGTIDAAAFLTLNNMPSSSVSQLEEIFEYRVLQLDDPENTIAEMQKINGGYIVNTLTPDNFKYLTEDVTFPTTSSVVGCLPTLSEDIVYEITKTVFDNLASVQEMAPDLKELTPELAVSLMVKDVPVHPGAAKYFKEIGVWDNSLTVGE